MSIPCSLLTHLSGLKNHFTTMELLAVMTIQFFVFECFWSVEEYGPTPLDGQVSLAV